MQANIYSQTPARKGLRHPRAAKSWVSTPAATQDDPTPQLAAAPSETPIASIDQRRDHVDNQLLAILTSPPAPGETAVIAFRRKETELLAVCAPLSPIESMQLARRLERAKTGDELAVAFGRLIVERRQRVIQFLNEARRRAALAGRK